MKIIKGQIFILMQAVFLAIHVCEIAARYPCNHTDNLYYPYIKASLVLLFAEVIVCSRRKTVVIPSVFFVFAAVLISHFENHYNIMTDYDTWINRGMPNWGEEGESIDGVAWNKIGGENGLRKILLATDGIASQKDSCGFFYDVECIPDENNMLYAIRLYESDQDSFGFVLSRESFFNGKTRFLAGVYRFSTIKRYSETCAWCRWEICRAESSCPLGLQK